LEENLEKVIPRMIQNDAKMNEPCRYKNDTDIDCPNLKCCVSKWAVIAIVVISVLLPVLFFQIHATIMFARQLDKGRVPQVDNSALQVGSIKFTQDDDRKSMFHANVDVWQNGTYLRKDFFPSYSVHLYITISIRLFDPGDYALETSISRSGTTSIQKVIYCSNEHVGW
jgi:hypothetical protein